MATKKKKAVETDGVYNRAVIYARFSPGPNQRDESIEGQVRECKEVAKKHGLMVIHEYIDKRMTGTNDDRPSFQRMLRDADRNLFDVVIVWKNDRFARNRYDSAIYKQRLKRNGIKLMYAKEHIPDGPEGIILESMLEGMAEYYSANLAQNIRRGQRENALERKFIGGTIPLGYKLDKEKRYIIDKEKAPLVREIFTRYISGESVIDICDDLNSRGHTTARGGKFNRSSLHRIFENEKYIGIYRFEDIEVKDGVPRLVSDEEFEAAAKRAERNKRSRRTVTEEHIEFMLTGKLFCGHCGQPMAGTHGTSKTGKKHYYYQCNGHKNRRGSCKKKPLRKGIIESAVTDCVVNNILKNDSVVNYIVDRCMLIQAQEADTSLADGLRIELAETEKALKNLLAAIEAGIFTPTTKNRLEELEERKANLLQGIAAAQIQPPKLTRDQLLFIFEKYQGRNVNDPEFMRDVIDTFVNKIFVYDDKLRIMFNFSDEKSIDISLSDVEEAATGEASSGFDYCSVASTTSVKVEHLELFFIKPLVFGVTMQL